MVTTTAIELEKNISQYLNLMIAENEIAITVNGNEIGRFIPKVSRFGACKDMFTIPPEYFNEWDNEIAKMFKDRNQKHKASRCINSLIRYVDYRC